VREIEAPRSPSRGRSGPTAWKSVTFTTAWARADRSSPAATWWAAWSG